MNDDEIIARGGTQDDINSYAESYGMTQPNQYEDKELRGSIGTLVKWLEEYHELQTNLLKFEHPADRENFYKLADKVSTKQQLHARIDELNKVYVAIDSETTSNECIFNLQNAIEDKIEGYKAELTKQEGK